MRENGPRKKTATLVVGAPLDHEEMDSEEREMEVILTRRIKWKNGEESVSCKEGVGVSILSKTRQQLDK